MGCEKGVAQALERLAGVTVLSVDRSTHQARVRVEEGTTSPDQIVAAIQGAGRFQAKPA
ncbi:MAG: heavy-metal-associated domain-containing protein [Candidatus Methylomirabilota bacterium]